MIFKLLDETFMNWLNSLSDKELDEIALRLRIDVR